jgi:hypothetical protein
MLQAALGIFEAGAGLFADVGGMVQAHLQLEEQLRWTQKQYRLDILSFSMDMLSQVKDEVKDLYECFSQRVDNLLVVHTLLLSLGFGVLQYSDAFYPGQYVWDTRWLQKLFLVAFAIIQALGIVIPFLAVSALVRCKQKLENWLDDSLRELHQEFEFKICRDGRMKPGPGAADLEADLHRTDLLDRQRDELIARIAGLVGKYHTSFDTMWRTECLGLYLLSSNLFWWAIVLTVSDVAMQMGVYLQVKYWDPSECGQTPKGDKLECVDAPEMFITYMGILALGAIACVCTKFSYIKLLCVGNLHKGGSREGSRYYVGQRRSIDANATSITPIDRRSYAQPRSPERSAGSVSEGPRLVRMASLREPLLGAQDSALQRFLDWSNPVHGPIEPVD